MTHYLMYVRGAFTNTYELLNLEALKIKFCINIKSFIVWVRYLCGILKGGFEIPLKISHSYIEKW